jgi:hypothetical protein
MEESGVEGRIASIGQIVASGLVVLGLALMAVSLVVPFASNEADCLDHCADANQYFVWHPGHNIGMPFSVIGVASAVALWRSARSRRRVLAWLGTLCGWLGLLLFYDYAPAIIEELYLYGGPALEVADTAWLLGAGWVVLFVGAVVSSPPPTPAEIDVPASSSTGTSGEPGTG